MADKKKARANNKQGRQGKANGSAGAKGSGKAKKAAGNKESGHRKYIVTGTIIALLIFIAVVVFAIAFTRSENDGKSANNGEQNQEQTQTETTETGENNAAEEEYRSEPVTPEEAYKNCEVLSVTEVGSSKALTEAEALALFEERGFGDITVTTCYEMDGSYHDDTEISGGNTRHPAYSGRFVTENGDHWSLLLYNDQLVADPVSYNLTKTGGSRIVISEAESVTSYDSVTNSFYQIIPDGTEMTVKKVGRIDAAALEELTSQRIGEL